MPEPRHWHIVLYDITDATRLRKAHKLLCAWGKAVQLSAFRVRLTARELERLRFELARIMTDEDRLMVVRLCDACASRVAVSGEPVKPFDLAVPFVHIV